jgi:hypothetical protein
MMCSFLVLLFVDQIVKLYERCVIACANYPEYWIRYVLCMEARESMDLANNVLARASQVFVKVISSKCQSCSFGSHLLLFSVVFICPVFKLSELARNTHI